MPTIPNVLARAAAWLDRAAFHPASLPDDLVTGIALTAPVVAGLIIFKVAAAEMLLVAVAIGGMTQLVLGLLWRKSEPARPTSPMMAAVFGVALVGVGAGLVTSVAIAALAVMLEVVRARFLPAVRAQTGLFAYAAVALVTKGAQAAYVRPADGLPYNEPITIWYRLFGHAAPGQVTWIDPITLYVGNVAGPVFATSLLAVAVGVAWLAYSRRVSFVVLASFLVGALVPIYLWHWDYLFQLDSGPTWFVAALVLADRRLLPESWAIRPVLGLVAGVLTIGFRRYGYGIESAFFTVAGAQAVIAVMAVAAWLTSTFLERWRRARRLRQREANLRVVKTHPRAG
jgi:hypothetical protein